MTSDSDLLRKHADRCRLLAQRMTEQHSIQILSRMADECSDLADGLDNHLEGNDQAELLGLATGPARSSDSEP